MITYIKNIFIALRIFVLNILSKPFTRSTALSLDRLVNAELHGNPFMTISQRAAFARDKFIKGSSNKIWGCVLCRILGSFDTKHKFPIDHCKWAIQKPDGTRYYVPEDFIKEPEGD